MFIIVLGTFSSISYYNPLTMYMKSEDLQVIYGLVPGRLNLFSKLLYLLRLSRTFFSTVSKLFLD